MVALARPPVVPPAVRVELVTPEARVGVPYRPMVPHALLRVFVQIAGPGGLVDVAREVVLEIDERGVGVHDRGTHTLIREIDTLFIVDRQPPRWRFFTWYGVFARRRGRCDQLIVETPDEAVARYVERAIEHRLGLDDAPVHGELRMRAD